jgi:hypothetical protein
MNLMHGQLTLVSLSFACSFPEKRLEAAFRAFEVRATASMSIKAFAIQVREFRKAVSTNILLLCCYRWSCTSFYLHLILSCTLQIPPSHTRTVQACGICLMLAQLMHMAPAKQIVELGGRPWYVCGS